jgi:metalloendopeptidase OMA1, mitochondrial
MKNRIMTFSRSWLIGACVAGALSGCSSVPITGRSQLNMVSQGEELELGLTSFQQMKTDIAVSADPAANALLQSVGKKIADVASGDLPNAQWEFVVFQSNEMNAFCLPGGKIGVYTGILPITANEAGLATVLGHEVAHAAAHHGAERMSEATMISIGGQLLGASLSKAQPTTQATAALLYGAGANLGRALPHGRLQESEADHMGLIYMARAGYDPRAAVEFWKRFAAATKAGDTTPWFLRTHPVTEERIRDLTNLLPEAVAEYERNRTPNK